jgi:hypothetical protein
MYVITTSYHQFKISEKKKSSLKMSFSRKKVLPLFDNTNGHVKNRVLVKKQTSFLSSIFKTNSLKTVKIRK